MICLPLNQIPVVGLEPIVSLLFLCLSGVPGIVALSFAFELYSPPKLNSWELTELTKNCLLLLLSLGSWVHQGELQVSLLQLLLIGCPSPWHSLILGAVGSLSIFARSLSVGWSFSSPNFWGPWVFPHEEDPLLRLVSGRIGLRWLSTLFVLALFQGGKHFFWLHCESFCLSTDSLFVPFCFGSSLFPTLFICVLVLLHFSSVRSYFVRFALWPGNLQSLVPGVGILLILFWTCSDFLRNFFSKNTVFLDFGFASGS